MVRDSTVMPFCSDSRATSFWMSAIGTTSSFSAPTIRPEDGQGARKAKS